MLKTILKFHDKSMEALDAGVQLKNILCVNAIAKIGRMKEITNLSDFDKLHSEVDAEFDKLISSR